MSKMLAAIREAIDTGRYRVDTAQGRIFGPEKELQIKRHAGQDCPTVRLHLLLQPVRSVPAHKVIAYAIWGEAAFAKGIHVRHLDGNTENNAAANLALGTPSQNERDKPFELRSRVGKAARAAQPATPYNAKIKPEHISDIRRQLVENTRNGRVRRGVVSGLAALHGVSPSAISLIGKGKSWA